MKITNIGRLFTATGAGVIVDAAIVIEGDRISWVGPASECPVAGDAVDAGGALMTPGLIDSHTHPVYAGDRFEEISLRSAGAGYQEIAERGGGIRSTVRATRAAGDLESVVAHRLRSWPRSGTTTVEAKTGYHLTRDGEIEGAGLLARLSGAPGLPRLVTTFLAAHAVPEEFEGRQADYAAEVAGWCDAAAAAGAVFVDVFCDQGYFTVEESRRILEAGRDAGLRMRIHADELARTGGSQLGADLGAVSADHLLEITDEDVAALASAGVVATLAPVTAMAMGATPPVRSLLDAGVTVALGTDHNPGTSGLTDMTIVIAAAVAIFGLSVEEALIAATVGGARSLALDDVGVVREGAVADLVLWDATHEGAFAWAWGVAPRTVWMRGELLALE